MQLEKYNSNTYIAKGYWSVEDVRKHPDKSFVFGDNLYRQGKGGQAIIRDEPNAFGFATKQMPNRKVTAFFYDDCIFCLDAVMHELAELSAFDGILVFPENGLGTGLSDMPNKCPKLYEFMTNALTLIIDTRGEALDAQNN